MNEPIEVVRANVLEDGAIVSDFNGFDDSSRFEFESGRVWEPSDLRIINALGVPIGVQTPRRSTGGP